MVVNPSCYFIGKQCNIQTSIAIVLSNIDNCILGHIHRGFKRKVLYRKKRRCMTLVTRKKNNKDRISMWSGKEQILVHKTLPLSCIGLDVDDEKLKMDLSSSY